MHQALSHITLQQLIIMQCILDITCDNVSPLIKYMEHFNNVCACS